MAGKNYKAENLLFGALLLAGAYWYFTSGTDAESPRADAPVERGSSDSGSSDLNALTERVEPYADPYVELAGESSNLTPEKTGTIAEKVRVCTDPDVQGASFRALSAGDGVESERLMDPSKCKWATPGMKVRLTGRRQPIQLSKSPEDTIEFREFEAPDGGLYWTSEVSFKQQ
ncbi:hypothetical protein VPK21_004720 [Sinorhizobium kummerowiae]|uniref:Uncharacterized protein n=1 Tax=Sinorhizobium kummerowiae TaxID=158892 RepID=A0ABY8TCY6_9HYPH|nr:MULTISPECIES: hypothetical protein [Sinorhizobium]RVP23816.1 hypothetical protein CN080_11855 [Sinorhizobium meliloti]WHS94568.1 hypothetical protein PZL22_002303 [Sinorhizobium kummerowiae]WRW46512.1 hypothetical protein VPK21_004720 [Sinorhizobium kummerowiae]